MKRRPWAWETAKVSPAPVSKPYFATMQAQRIRSMTAVT